MIGTSTKEIEMTKLQMIDEIAQAVVYGAVAFSLIGGAAYLLVYAPLMIAAKSAGL